MRTFVQRCSPSSAGLTVYVSPCTVASIIGEFAPDLTTPRSGRALPRHFTPAHGLRNGPEVPSKPGPKVPVSRSLRKVGLLHTRVYGWGVCIRQSARNNERHSTSAGSTVGPGPFDVRRLCIVRT